MKLSRFCLAVVMILVWSIASWGQSEPNLETGFKPYGSYQHDDFDSVSLTSGALILHIPVGTAYPQRGGRMNGGEHLFLNSKTFSVKLVPENASIQYWAEGSWSPGQMASGNPLWPNPTRSYNTLSVGSFVHTASAINYLLTSGDGSQHPLADVTTATGEPGIAGNRRCLRLAPGFDHRRRQQCALQRLSPRPPGKCLCGGLCLGELHRQQQHVGWGNHHARELPTGEQTGQHD